MKFTTLTSKIINDQENPTGEVVTKEFEIKSDENGNIILPIEVVEHFIVESSEALKREGEQGYTNTHLLLVDLIFQSYYEKLINKLTSQ